MSNLTTNEQRIAKERSLIDQHVKEAAPGKGVLLVLTGIEL